MNRRNEIEANNRRTCLRVRHPQETFFLECVSASISAIFRKTTPPGEDGKNFGTSETSDLDGRETRLPSSSTQRVDTSKRFLVDVRALRVCDSGTVAQQEIADALQHEERSGRSRRHDQVIDVDAVHVIEP